MSAIGDGPRAPSSSDTLLRRLALTACICCAAMAAAAFALAGGFAALAVLGGGGLVATSFGGIARVASAMMPVPDHRARRPARALTLAVLVGRYGLLAFLAYVMIARLRMPPLALLAGASSVVAAVAIEAGRLLLQRRH
ncbi:MAG: hypothetical protein DMF86_14855 [Acidobacteria bacterium]|nr:MAG: hypothetical protein DMF86_14855 [Acidobacteriota bacterium]